MGVKMSLRNVEIFDIMRDSGAGVRPSPSVPWLKFPRQQWSQESRGGKRGRGQHATPPFLRGFEVGAEGTSVGELLVLFTKVGRFLGKIYFEYPWNLFIFM
jgi:hypothetical protein